MVIPQELFERSVQLEGIKGQAPARRQGSRRWFDRARE